MRLLNLLRARLQRRFDVQSLGPNEARIFYDAGVATTGVVITLLFAAIFRGGIDWTFAWRLLIAPALLLCCNVIGGIYSRLRKAKGRVKAIWLLVAVVVTAGVVVTLGVPSESAVLWAVVSYPPLAMARLLLSLPFSRHKKLVSIAVNHRGPVLVIGGAGYIGSHTTDLLLQQGHSVRVLDRLMYGREPIQDFLDNGKFELLEGDATDIAKLTQAMKPETHEILCCWIGMWTTTKTRCISPNWSAVARPY